MSVITITNDAFESEVMNSDQPVIVEFWAPMCPFCMILSPVLERLSGKLGDSIVIGKVNVSEQPELEERFNVNVVPTLFLFQGGTHGEGLIAPMSQAKIESWLKTQVQVKA